MKKNAPRHHGIKASARHGFTLTEALVAVAILLAVILFVSKIFASVSKVTQIGQGAADIMQEVAAIERQIRQDIERMSRDGYLVIVSRAVRNDINGALPRLLLNPDLPADAWIRADQLLFFTDGMHGFQIHRAGQGENRKAQSTTARVYYGHGFQLGDAPVLPGQLVASSEPDLPPWRWGAVQLENPGGNIPFLTQPGARSWTLARQAVLLADDGLSPDVYLNQGATTATMWDNAIRNSSVDGAATLLDDVRRDITQNDTRPWNQQWGRILASVMTPRAERGVVTSVRSHHAASTATLGSAVSDFIVEWTYGDDTGFVTNPLTTGPAFYGGVNLDNDTPLDPSGGGINSGPQPWFGMPDAATPTNPPRGVGTLASQVDWTIDPNGPVFPAQFEVLDISSSQERFYSATFGFNQSRPLNDLPGTVGFGEPWDTSIPGVQPYTPWPTALRITMRLHDVGANLPNGRVIQFVVTLPPRR